MTYRIEKVHTQRLDADMVRVNLTVKGPVETAFKVKSSVEGQAVQDLGECHFDEGGNYVGSFVIEKYRLGARAVIMGVLKEGTSFGFAHVLEPGESYLAPEISSMIGFTGTSTSLDGTEDTDASASFSEDFEEEEDEGQGDKAETTDAKKKA